jgi:hypothetical protein
MSNRVETLALVRSELGVDESSPGLWQEQEQVIWWIHLEDPIYASNHFGMG